MRTGQGPGYNLRKDNRRLYGSCLAFHCQWPKCTPDDSPKHTSQAYYENRIGRCFWLENYHIDGGVPLSGANTGQRRKKFRAARACRNCMQRRGIRNIRLPQHRRRLCHGRNTKIPGSKDQMGKRLHHSGQQRNRQFAVPEDSCRK